MRESLRRTTVQWKSIFVDYQIDRFSLNSNQRRHEMERERERSGRTEGPKVASGRTKQIWRRMEVVGACAPARSVTTRRLIARRPRPRLRFRAPAAAGLAGAGRRRAFPPPSTSRIARAAHRRNFPSQTSDDVGYLMIISAEQVITGPHNGSVLFCSLASVVCRRRRL